MAIQLAPWMLKAGLALGKAGLGYLEGRRKQKQLDNLSKITPAERDYVKRQREIADSGDPRLANALNKQTSIIRQQGAFERSRIGGSLVRQGLENSIVADELRRKVDKGVMDKITEESGRIAEANRLAKIQAEDNITNFNLKRDERLRQLAMKSAGVSGGSQLGNILQAGADIGLGVMGDKAQFKKDNPWLDLGKEAFSLGEDATAEDQDAMMAKIDQYLTNLPEGLRSGFLTWLGTK